MQTVKSRVWGDGGPGQLLDLARVKGAVDEFLVIADDSTWNRYGAFRWEEARPERLTDGQRLAVEFVTMVEDHLPTYFGDYNDAFPLTADIDVETYLHNRAIYHFTVRWAMEEDRHAHVLREYQVRTGMAEADKLDRALAEEGKKHFTPEVSSALELFAYTLIQEKATQLYYQQLRSAVDEPVLKEVLTSIARDEARHFAFFFNLVGGYLQSLGEASIPILQGVARRFKMPLHSTMKNYWRRALVVREAAGDYDHTEAFDALIRVIERFGDAPSRSKAVDLKEFVRAMHG